MKKNQEFLTSIIECAEFCGRQGLALRGHRDDSTTVDKKHQGNFRSLLDFHIDAGDKVLEEHLAKDPKNASYISKTTQNELLDCVKKYIHWMKLSKRSRNNQLVQCSVFKLMKSQI